MTTHTINTFKTDPLVKSFYKFVWVNDLRKKALDLLDHKKVSNYATRFVPPEDSTDVLNSDERIRLNEISYEELAE